MTDTFDQIIAEYDETPLLYGITVATLHEYAGTGHTTAGIGLLVWGRLTRAERREALGDLLESYVSRVAWEESAQACQAAADTADTLGSCLQPFDLDCVADSIVGGCELPLGPDEIAIERDVAQRILDELARLRRRLDATTAEATP